MTAEYPQGDEPLIPMRALSLPALRQAVATVAPSRLPEFFQEIQDAFTQAGARHRDRAESRAQGRWHPFCPVRTPRNQDARSVVGVTECDLLIVGAGPVGLYAAYYAGRGSEAGR
jgi:NADPH-dependent 2,4-dienoyl-CoA reductase/sulfur reductase-like enzyme